MILKVENLNVYIGTLNVLRGISLEVDEDETVVLVGRNGAGKTSTLKSIIGLLNVKSGKVLFKEKNITNMPPHKVAKLGIGYCPEDRRIFPDLTAEENIELAIWMGGNTNKEKEIWNTILSVFPELGSLRRRRGAHLSGGEQKMLSIARALALSPSLLLLDEPLEGLAPIVVKRLSEAIQRIKKLGISMLIAESNVKRAPLLGDRVYVIERGEIIFEGAPEEIYENKDVMRVFALI